MQGTQQFLSAINTQNICTCLLVFPYHIYILGSRKRLTEMLHLQNEATRRRIKKFILWWRTHSVSFPSSLFLPVPPPSTVFVVPVFSFTGTGFHQVAGNREVQRQSTQGNGELRQIRVTAHPWPTLSCLSNQKASLLLSPPEPEFPLKITACR